METQPRHAFSLYGDQIIGTAPVQEDSFGIQSFPGEGTASTGGFIALADGVGGAPDGELASQEAVRATMAALSQKPDNMCDVARMANHHLAEAKKAGRMDQAACTTLLAVSYGGGGISWISAGDSLLLLWDSQRLHCLNKRHTRRHFLLEQLRADRISQEEFDRVPEEELDAIYSCINGDPLEHLDVGEHILRPGERVLVASDGLLALSENRLASLLRSMEGRSPKETVDVLLAAVQQKNLPEQDNTTLVVLDYGAQPSAGRPVFSASLLGDAPRQEDSVWHISNAHATFAIVADGAGGHAGGDLASATAVRCAKRLWESGLSAGLPPHQAEELLSRYLTETNETVRREAVQPGAFDSGKSAAVLLYLCGGTATIAHVGDCRAYVRHASGFWEKLTDDDSILQVGLRAGFISPKDAWQHPDQNRLTQALGTAEGLTPHVKSHPAAPTDAFLLCCDGFWNQLRPEIWQNAPIPTESIPQLPHLWATQAVAAKPGKSDNVSLIFIPSTLVPESPAPRQGRRRSAPLVFLALPVLLLGLVLASFFIFRPHRNPQQERDNGLNPKPDHVEKVEQPSTTPPSQIEEPVLPESAFQPKKSKSSPDRHRQQSTNQGLSL